jgi:lysophospholipase L1-like esterase
MTIAILLTLLGTVTITTERKLIACVGDSTTETPYLGPYSSGNWPSYAQTTLGSVYGLANKGLSADTVAMAYTRWETSVPIKTLAPWDAVALLIGVNDLNAGTSAATIETTLSSFEASLAGMTPVPVLYYIRVVPWGGFSGWSAGDEAQADLLWAWQQSRCAANPARFRCINTASLADAGSPAGQPSLPASYTTDGLHWTNAGAVAMGALVAAAIAADPP